MAGRGSIRRPATGIRGDGDACVAGSGRRGYSARPRAPRAAMQAADFDYHLPPERIAQTPLTSRSASRLLDLSGAVPARRRFADLVDCLGAGDLLVVNDTQVVKARLRALKDSGGAAEVLLERATGHRTALCQVRVSKPLHSGRWLQVAGHRIEVLGRDGPFYELQFPQPLFDFLERHGEVPLPPYITPGGEAAAHEDRYQTLFARAPGAVAAPTAGLHFTPELLAAVRDRGVEVAELTLHVGAGTFTPVRDDDIATHRMHSERFVVPAATLQAVAAARRVVAVGTTVVRALETAAAAGALTATPTSDFSGATELFITPGFRFRAVQALITNFHLPRSTLLMLVCAFAGYRRVMAAYRLAVAQRYRFFSYGDAMLLSHDPNADLPPGAVRHV